MEGGEINFDGGKESQERSEGGGDENVEIIYVVGKEVRREGLLGLLMKMGRDRKAGGKGVGEEGVMGRRAREGRLKGKRRRTSKVKKV